MATLVLGGIGSYFGGPVGGYIGVLAGSYIDSRYIYPKLLGGNDAQPTRLLDIPVGNNDPGAPRFWAIGRAIRVPTRVLWSGSRVIDTSSTTKQGAQIQQHKVTANALIAFNSRKTHSLVRLIANGANILDYDNFVTEADGSDYSAIGTSDTTIDVSGTTMRTTGLATVFQVGDRVRLNVWRSTASGAGGDVYRVTAVANAHGSSYTTMSLELVLGVENLSGALFYAGTEAAPGGIERVDFALITDSWTVATYSPGQNGGSTGPCSITLTAPADVHPLSVFQVNDRVTFNHWTYTTTAGQAFDSNKHVNGWKVAAVSTTQIRLVHTDPNVALPPISATVTWTFDTSHYIGAYGAVFRFWATIAFTLVNRVQALERYFPSTFVPVDHGHDGSEDQGEESILVAEKGSGNISAFRGIAYQGLKDFNLSEFGSQMPYSLDAIIQPDRSMTWAQAFREVLLRASIPDDAIDVSGCAQTQFGGGYLRGAAPTISAMQPMLVASQTVGQERDGVICMFAIENADVVQVANGTEYSDLGARIWGDPPKDDKLQVQQPSLDDLPTSVAVRYQDVRRNFTEQYEPFGKRNPSAGEIENRREIDLRSLAMDPESAKNIGATMMRRAYVNGTTVGLTLNACYLDVLENDVLTVTDDEGQDWVVRVLQRDAGTNMLVRCQCCVEDLTLAVTGSPVQSSAGTAPPTIPNQPLIDAVVLDMPALSDDMGRQPGLAFFAASRAGCRWFGVTIYESTDNGTSWDPVDTIEQQGATGYTKTDFASASAAESFGSTAISTDSQSIDVYVENTGPVGLFSIDRQFALQGANWCAIVDPDGNVEITAFLDVVQVDTNTFTLTNWLRGLRGTTPSAKTAGARFVLLWPFELAGRFRSFPGLQSTRTLLYRFVPPGSSIDDVGDIAITSTWRNACPLPIRSLTKSIDGSNNATFTVDHWTRTVLPVGSQGPYPLDETYETYQFDLYTASGTGLAIRRTVTSRGTGAAALRDKFATFTAAELTAAGYTPGPSISIWIDVAQVGDYGVGPSILRSI